MIAEHYRSGQFGLSFELFPPRSQEAEEKLQVAVGELIRFGPSFITCTYGAGGSTRDKTLDVVSWVKHQHQLPVAAHLTCVGSTVDGLRAFLQDASDRGIDYIVALRGDPPKGETSFKPVEGGLHYANELVALVRAEFPRFSVAVAGYPETHREAPGPDDDLMNLKRKVDAGADVVITQLFYQADVFFEFRDRCRSAEIDVPIVPGVLPVTSAGQLERVVTNCGANMPVELFEKLQAHAENPDAQSELGLEHCTRLLEKLLEGGIPGLHFYVLNRSHATSRILEAVALPDRNREKAPRNL